MTDDWSHAIRVLSGTSPRLARLVAGRLPRRKKSGTPLPTNQPHQTQTQQNKKKKKIKKYHGHNSYHLCRRGPRTKPILHPRPKNSPMDLRRGQRRRRQNNNILLPRHPTKPRTQIRSLDLDRPGPQSERCVLSKVWERCEAGGWL